MFLLDDILLSPARGLLSVFRNVHDAAQEEFVHEAEAIRIQLSEMYVLLETGQLSDEDFDRRERVLLDRLEKVEAPAETNSGELGEERDDEEDGVSEDDHDDQVDEEEADDDSPFEV